MSNDIPADVKLTIHGQTEKAKSFLSELSNMQLETQEDLDWAAQATKLVKDCLDDVEAAEKRITAPINAALQAARAHFAPAKQIFKSCEMRLKQLMGEFHARLQAARIEQVQAGAMVLAPPEAPKGVTIKSQIGFTVVEPDLVPREFCSPDAQKIQKALNRGIMSIPGVSYTEKQQVRVRR